MNSGNASPWVVVSGASSQLGVFLLPLLKRSGFRVVALSRRAPTTPLEVDAEVSWLHPEEFLKQSNRSVGFAPRAEFLVSCGPLDLAASLARASPALKRVVAFSTSSVFAKATSGDAAEIDLVAQIAGQEKALRKLCGVRGVPLLLLRPTLIYGCGLDNNVSLLARLGRRAGFVPIAGEAVGLRQPVHAEDLAGVAVQALDTAQSLDFDSPACGGSTLSYREMAARAMSGMTGRSRLLPLPAAVMVATVRILSQFGPWRGLNTEMVHRQGIDLVFDDSALRTALNYDPRPFEPTPGDFDIPAFAQKLQINL